MPKKENRKSVKDCRAAIILQKARQFSSMIRISHTVFALPFALTAVVIIVKNDLADFSWQKVLFVVLAFTGARSFSMSVNRIADAKIDADNPRTKNREIPAGVLSVSQVWVFAAISVIVTSVFAWLLTPLAFYLSFPAMALLAGYSYSKRFTWLCHIWLGSVIGMAPLGVYIALTQSLPVTSWILFAILTTYIGGFDILYSLQDIEFDRKQKLYSIPARFGVNASLFISSVLHVFTVIGFFWLGYHEILGVAYYIGAVLLTILVFLEHKSIGWSDNLKLDKIPIAFFNYNSAISVLFFLFVLAGAYSQKSLFTTQVLQNNNDATPLNLKLSDDHFMIDAANKIFSHNKLHLDINKGLKATNILLYNKTNNKLNQFAAKKMRNSDFILDFNLYLKDKFNADLVRNFNFKKDFNPSFKKGAGREELNG